MANGSISTKVLISLHWQDSDPVFRTRIDNQQGTVTESALNYPLLYRVTSESKKFCLGHTAMTKTGSSYEICLEKPQQGRKCSKCFNADARYAANLHQSHKKKIDEVPQEFRSHMDQPNLLYLACFADGSLKVGTTTLKRKERRLREQGALWASIVARTPNGYAVRVLEDLVTEQLSIRQAVSTKKKVAGLANPLNENDAREKLGKVLQQVETLLLDTQDLEYEILGTDWENEALKNSIWKNVHQYPRDLTEGAHSLKIVDVIGRVGALSPANSKDVFVADLDPLFGVEIEIGEFPTEDLLVQDALF